MPTGSFAKTNVGWQIHQLSQRLGEWVELKLKTLAPKNIPLFDWLPNWSIAPWVPQAIFWSVLGLLLIWLGLQAVQLLSPGATWRRRSSTSSDPSPTAKELAVAAWLRKAQEFQRQGNYGEACRALYMAMLQRLHETKSVAHQSSRTDGEYLQLVQDLPQPAPYETLIATHEQLCFGNTLISAETFQQCQRAYGEIDAP